MWVCVKSVGCVLRMGVWVKYEVLLKCVGVKRVWVCVNCVGVKKVCGCV